MRASFTILIFALAPTCLTANGKPTPRIVAHRGLFKHAPENTLPAFAACLELRVGFELDIRRTKNGVLVCMHDEDVRRTTNGKGKVADLTVGELRKLDAGGWFDARFAGTKVPTLEQVFSLIRLRGATDLLIALDIKFEDDALAADVMELAKMHGVLKQVVCIGLTISDAKLRAKLRAADAQVPLAVLAQKREDLSAALDAKNVDWVYVRYIPTSDEVRKIHGLGKRVFLAGPLVAGNEPANWRAAQAAGVDALLTDYPLECAEVFRQRSAK